MLLEGRPVDSSSQGNVTNPNVVSTDPACNKTKTDTYNERLCRLDTWRAMVDIFNSGKARSIGGCPGWWRPRLHTVRTRPGAQNSALKVGPPD